MEKVKMLKKYYQKEVEVKEAMNNIAKENSTRSEDRIEYDVEHPLVINESTKILELGIHKDEYDFGCLEENYRGRKVIRIVFKNEEYDYLKRKKEDEVNPYILDVSTRLSLEDFENQLSKCESEDEIMDLSE